MSGTDKITRILLLFQRLMNGEFISKSLFSLEHNITERSFDRDIEDIRLFLSDSYSTEEVLFDVERKAYYHTGSKQRQMSEVEILIFSKLLLDSRAFSKDELDGLHHALLSGLSAHTHSGILSQLKNEKGYYAPVHRNKAIIKTIWDLNTCINKGKKLELNYSKSGGEVVKRLAAPIGIVFSEFYFYLVAFMDEDKYEFPAFYRVDRIISFEITELYFSQKLKRKYHSGQMKKFLPFMTAGELITVTLRCEAFAIEPVLDRFPTAEIIEENTDGTVVKIKVFSGGFIRWVIGQGRAITVITPEEIRDKICEEIEGMRNNYF